jgi:hypothetical protein
LFIAFLDYLDDIDGFVNVKDLAVDFINEGKEDSF